MNRTYVLSIFRSESLVFCAKRQLYDNDVVNPTSRSRIGFAAKIISLQ